MTQGMKRPKEIVKESKVDLDNPKTEEMWRLCEETTDKMCKILGLDTYLVANGVECFTPEAQGIFNDLVDLTDYYLTN